MPLAQARQQRSWKRLMPSGRRSQGLRRHPQPRAQQPAPQRLTVTAGAQACVRSVRCCRCCRYPPAQGLGCGRRTAALRALMAGQKQRQAHLQQPAHGVQALAADCERDRLGRLRCRSIAASPQSWLQRPTSQRRMMRELQLLLRRLVPPLRSAQRWRQERCCSWRRQWWSWQPRQAQLTQQLLPQR